MTTATVRTNNNVTAMHNAVPIDERAVLVDFSKSIWSARVTDERISREVAEQHGTQRNVGNYRKQLIAREALAEIRSILREAYEYHNNVTLPWLNNGTRIMSSTIALAYIRRMREFQSRLAPAVAKFVKAYPQLKEDAKQFLPNGLYNEADYPDEASIASRFAIAYEINKVPRGGDFRVLDMDAAAVAQVQRTIDRTVDERIEQAMRDPYARIAERLGVMVDRLTRYTGQPSKTAGSDEVKKWYDAWIDNVRELVDLLPALNIANDPKLDRLTEGLREKVLAFDNDTLRQSEVARAKTIKAADDIMKAVRAFKA